ncbi:MAG: hypothetical protein S4CHLAM81_08830 [Chlamydiales bacterium]|nr:hypothetical protein [Chlamydiales bacterium]MCH9635663.1 hypothetical protein [Chlamydiales bacterium]
MVRIPRCPTTRLDAAVMGNPKKSLAALVALVAAAALVTVSFIPQTRAVMQGGWHKVGHGFSVAAHKIKAGYTSKGALGKGLRIGTAVWFGIGIVGGLGVFSIGMCTLKQSRQ